MPQSGARGADSAEQRIGAETREGLEAVSGVEAGAEGCADEEMPPPVEKATVVAAGSRGTWLWRR